MVRILVVALIYGIRSHLFGCLHRSISPQIIHGGAVSARHTIYIVNFYSHVKSYLLLSAASSKRANLHQTCINHFRLAKHCTVLQLQLGGVSDLIG